MNSEILLDKLKPIGMMPVLCLENVGQADTLARALLRTPVHIAEITLRHPYASEAIRYLKTKYPELTVGAGTIISRKTFDAAIAAGADFLVSPGFDESIAALAQKHDISFIPGCVTPTEALTALRAGCTILKFFPADTMGGVKTLKLFEGALQGIPFMATGGINADNLAEFLSCKNLLCCGGSSMVPRALLDAGDDAGIAEKIMEITAICHAVRGGSAQ